MLLNWLKKVPYHTKKNDIEGYYFVTAVYNKFRLDARIIQRKLTDESDISNLVNDTEH